MGNRIKLLFAIIFFTGIASVYVNVGEAASQEYKQILRSKKECKIEPSKHLAKIGDYKIYTRDVYVALTCAVIYTAIILILYYYGKKNN